MSRINLYISMYNDVRLPKRLLYGELGDSGQHKRCKVKVSLRSFSIDPIDCETTAVNRGEWRDRIPNGAQPSTKRQILAAAEESRQFTDYGLSFRAASALFHYRGHTALWGSVIDAVIIFCGMCVFFSLKNTCVTSFRFLTFFLQPTRRFPNFNFLHRTTISQHAISTCDATLLCTELASALEDEDIVLKFCTADVSFYPLPPFLLSASVSWCWS